MRVRVWFPIVAALGAALGCRQASDDAGSTARPPAASGLPNGMLLTAAPPEAQPVGALRASARPGDLVVVRGRIGGQAQPFVAGRAVFTIADPSLPPCNANPADRCPTPWDYCCEPREALQAQTATVQIVGADGRPLALELQGLGGLRPLAEVFVRGRLESSARGANLITAEGLYVSN